MFLDPSTGEVIDFVGGRADLEARVLRAIGDPAARFAEDKLRLLRAVRFAARFGLAIEPATRVGPRGDGRPGPGGRRRADRAGAAEDARPPDPVEGDGPGDGHRPDRGRPPAAGRGHEGLFQGKPIQPDGDLWDHTLLVLDLLPPEPSFPLAFAALLHDVGKPDDEGRSGTAG